MGTARWLPDHDHGHRKRAGGFTEKLSIQLFFEVFPARRFLGRGPLQCSEYLGAAGCSTVRRSTKHFCLPLLRWIACERALKNCAYDHTEICARAKNVKLIIFLATPHTGSGLADLALYLGFFLRNSVAVSDLTAQNPRLRDLNLWFRNNFDKLGLQTLIFFETKETRGVRVVNESSADPGIPPISPTKIDANHSDIAIPRHPSSIVIGQTLKAFDEAVPSTIYRFRSEDFR
jgi:hypothetical protein